MKIIVSFFWLVSSREFLTLGLLLFGVLLFLRGALRGLGIGVGLCREGRRMRR